MPKSRWVVWGRLAWALVLVPIVGGFFWIWSQGGGASEPFLSAAKPRAAYQKSRERYHGPPLPAKPIDPLLYQDARITSTSDEIVLDFPDDGNDESNVFPFTPHDVALGAAARLGSATLRLAAIETASFSADFQPDPTSEERRFDKTQIFDERLEPTTREAMRERYPELATCGPVSDRSHSSFPNIQFDFAFDADDWHVLGFAMYDARTQCNLSSGYSSSKHEKAISIQTEQRILHRAPVDVILDVAVGPSRQAEFEPFVGEGFAAEGIDFRLLACVDGIRGMSSGSDSRTAGRREVTLTRDRSGKGDSGFIFACQPAQSLPIEVALLDREGKSIGQGTSASGSVMMCHGPEGGAEQVERIRVRYWPNFHRVVFHLPCLPGCPEENAEIENLFDVRVPYVFFTNQGEAQRFLTGILELQGLDTRWPAAYVGPVLPPPPPVEFRNATVLGIANHYAQAQGTKVYVGPDSTQAQFREPKTLIENLKELLARIF